MYKYLQMEPANPGLMLGHQSLTQVLHAVLSMADPMLVGPKHLGQGLRAEVRQVDLLSPLSSKGNSKVSHSASSI